MNERKLREKIFSRDFPLTLARQFTRRKSHPVIQFVKYGIGGVLATIADLSVFSALAWKIFPCLKEDELVVRLFSIEIPQVDDSARAMNYASAKVISFLFANFVAYLVNIAWVFERGKYSYRMEIFLFYAVSIVSFILGTLVGMGLIYFLNFSAGLSYVANTVASVMINYICRKRFIFKG